MEWDEVSWVLRGKLKQKVLKSVNKPKTATILSKELKTHRSTISDILKQMTKKDLVICLDTEQPYNRFYKLTEKGRKLLKGVEELSHCNLNTKKETKNNTLD